MKIGQARASLVACIVAVAFLDPAVWAQAGKGGAQEPCAGQKTFDVPQVSISNGQVYALINLPDPQKGYYRSTRFDWSGVVPCLSYDGHTYFSPWRPTHDPLGHDSLSGPVEEFNPLGYVEAKPGEPFVKPGVGVLRKIEDVPYRFSTLFPIIDNGKWSYRARKSEISMTHHLSSPLGYAYEYTKTLKLEKGKPVLLIQHHFKNTGTKVIDTEVYDHDFYRLDDAATGPDMVVHFVFAPTATRPLTNGGEIKGNDVTYQNELPARGSVSSFLTGYSDKPSDYDFTVRNVKTGVGVEQTSDSPIASLNFWSVKATIAPEAYIHLHMEPGKSQDYTIRYRFFDK